MKFCPVCRNMYFIKVKSLEKTEEAGVIKDIPPTLVYYCRRCGNEDIDTDMKENVVVYRTKLVQTQDNFDHIINKYTKLDPNLPRVTNIPCPNDKCITNEEVEEGREVEKVENEVIKIRYDEVNMRYIYLCAHCDHVWKPYMD